jgi:probable addiction module antidote protein
MSEERDKSILGPDSSRSEIADCINNAFKSGEIVAICQAIGDATRLHNVSDLAKKANLGRTGIYRAFEGGRSPNFSTVLSVLDAIGFQLRVIPRPGPRAKLARAENRDER